MLDELDQPGLLLRETGRLRDFMFVSCRMLEPVLPPAAADWLQVADRYRHGEASAVDLERVRVAAWEFLGKNSCDFTSPGVLAVRAVICLLFPDEHEGGDWWFETVHFFLDASNRAADHQGAQSQLLRQLFAEYLGDCGRG